MPAGRGFSPALFTSGGLPEHSVSPLPSRPRDVDTTDHTIHRDRAR
jgi:hypothetical protein